MSDQLKTLDPIIPIVDSSSKRQLRDLPWWLYAIFLIAIYVYFMVTSSPTYIETFVFIQQGIKITVSTTLKAFSAALILGLIAGLGRISKNVVINNLARMYVELIRGIPILVLIFFIALVGVPMLVD